MQLARQDFYFLRHGETDWNLEHRGMGQKDIPLNKRGEQQARAAIPLLKSEPVKLICHSPLQRAKVTAQILAEGLSVPLFEVQDLQECSWGEKEGEVKGRWTEDWIAGALIAGAESYEEFLPRALGGINQALAQPGPVLVVAHGGVFWAVQKFAQLGARFDLPNACPVLLRAPAENYEPWAYTFLDPEI